MFSKNDKITYIYSKLIIGASVSIVGFIVMYNSIEIESGIIFDGRSVLMLLTGMFFGVVPALMGAFTLSLYRIVLGGAGVVPGIIWVVVPGVIGVIWRHYRLKKNNVDISDISVVEQYLLILGSQILMIGILFMFPNKVTLNAINAIAIPITVLYPVGGLIVSAFMLRQRRHYANTIALANREKEYNDLFNGGSHSSFVVDENNNFIKVNQIAIDMYGYSEEEFLKMSVYDINVSSKEQLQKIIDKRNKQNRVYVNLKHKLKNGEIIDVEVRSTAIELDGVKLYYSNIANITSRLEDEVKYRDVNQKLKVTLNGVSDGILVTDEYGNIEMINDVGKRHLLENRSSVIGRKITDIVRIYSNDQKADLNDIYNFVMTNNKSFTSSNPYILITNDLDETLYINFSLSPITYSDGVNKGSILIFRDVTIDFEKTNKIEYVSQHDFLTGLYNRYFLEEELKRLDTVRQLPLTLIIGDVNSLKLINDSYGHIEGDNLLTEIAQILKKSTRSEDIISRWGGDEFLILLPQTSKENAEKVRTRIKALSQKSMFSLITPSISIGIATKTKEIESMDQILVEAEKEMYFNKQTDGKITRKEFLENLSARLHKIHPDLGSHSSRMAKKAKEFAKYLKLKSDDLDTLIKLATYHDIGWIGIDDYLLLKTDQITDAETEKIRQHPGIGFRIMKSIPELAYLSDLVISHHERWDGTGFPENLQGEDIPYLSRVLYILDAFDMMTNVSVFMETRSLEDALNELNLYAGTQFDPKIVDLFIQMHKKTI